MACKRVFLSIGAPLGHLEGIRLPGLFEGKGWLIWVLINFRFQLNAQYFISVTMLLYMFRAPLRPSSGGPLYIYNIWFYVSLFW